MAIEGERQHTVSSGQVELAVLQAGDPAAPAVVCVHGYPDTKELWLPVLRRLAPRFHVIAYDVRGAGASGAPRGAAAYDFERLADDLMAVLDAVSPDRPAHLVGHDWGGIAGWEFASDRRFEGRLTSFTTIAGPSLDQVSRMLRGRVRGGHAADALCAVYRSWYVLALSTPGIPALMWRGFLARRWESGFQDNDYPTPALVESGINGANLYRQNILRRPRRQPRPTHVPVQLIVPEGDRFISPAYYEEADRYAKSLRRHTVAGEHWLPRTEPELIAKWIAQFVEEVETA